MLRASHDCTIVHLGETLSCNGIFRATTTRVLHLLGACPIVLCLACGSQWTNILKCLYSSIFTKTLPYRLVLRKLVHEHLLVRLRGCKHIGISFRGHFDELFVVSLHLGHVLIRDLMRRVSTGRTTGAILFRCYGGFYRTFFNFPNLVFRETILRYLWRINRIFVIVIMK